MSDLKPRGVPIVLEGVERHFLFTLNCIDAIQTKYEKPMLEVLDEITDEDPSRRTLREIVTILLNDEAERNARLGGTGIQTVTEEDVGYMIGMDNRWEVVKAVLKAYDISIPANDEDDPNRESGQQSS